MENSNLAVYSVCNIAYLSKAMVLAESLYKNDNIQLNLFLFDTKRELDIETEYCEIHWVEDLDIPNFKQLAFKYNVIEFTTALKPSIALFLLEKYSKVIFFDPDIMVFNSISPIRKKLEENKFLLTPHFITPKLNNIEKDVSLMRFGFFNLGFFASDDSIESRGLLNWWSRRCTEEGFDDSQYGIFTDQKWLSIAPYYFPFVKIIYDNIYNVAYWNLFERTLLQENGKYYVGNINESSALIFFHFSRLSKDEKSITYSTFDQGGNSDEILHEITQTYKKTINKYPFSLDNYRYSYDYFDNGHFVSPTLRRAYAACYPYFASEVNPFIFSDKMKGFMKKNNLTRNQPVPYSNKSYSDIEENKLFFKVYYSFLKIILKLIGPTKFMDLSRLFYYSSSYQRMINFWKT